LCHFLTTVWGPKIIKFDQPGGTMRCALLHRKVLCAFCTQGGTPKSSVSNRLSNVLIHIKTTKKGNQKNSMGKRSLPVRYSGKNALATFFPSFFFIGSLFSFSSFAIQIFSYFHKVLNASPNLFLKLFQNTEYHIFPVSLNCETLLFHRELSLLFPISDTSFVPPFSKSRNCYFSPEPGTPRFWGNHFFAKTKQY